MKREPGFAAPEVDGLFRSAVSDRERDMAMASLDMGASMRSMMLFCAHGTKGEEGEEPVAKRAAFREHMHAGDNGNIWAA